MNRLPIGIAETIETMPREELSFYRGYYRPENTLIAFIGDVEPEVAVAKIEEYFGDWKAQGPALGQALPGPAELKPGRVGYFFDEKLMTSVTLGALRPYEERPDTRATRRENLIRAIGSRILNRRFNRKVEQGEATYLSGGASRYRFDDVIDGMTLTVRATPEDWVGHCWRAGASLALQYGFSQDELDEQLAIIRQARETAVERADTRKTYAGFEYNYAKELVSARTGQGVHVASDHPRAVRRNCADDHSGGSRTRIPGCVARHRGSGDLLREQGTAREHRGGAENGVDQIAPGCGSTSRTAQCRCFSPTPISERPVKSCPTNMSRMPMRIW